jgi:O-antigen/teichoic acid export membrane protein
MLDKILKLINIIGMLSIVFGIPLAGNILNVLYGEKWTHESVV